MKKVIVLGAGIYQVPLIKQAKSMGLYVIVISIKGNYPGFELADKCYYVNTRDYEKILEIALEEKIDGICTVGTDVAVKAIGYVCEKMNLPGLDFSCANKATDKFLMKEAFKNYGVRTSKFVKTKTVQEAIDFLNITKKPLVLKPVDSSGSRGVTKVQSPDEIFDKFDEILKFSAKDYIIAEEFIEGKEIGIDLFVLNNKIVLNAVHGKITYNNGFSDVPIGHYFPFEVSDELSRDIIIQIEKVVDAMGFNNCAVNMDVLIKDEKIYIIEASGRVGATCIPELISKHYGFNFYEKIIKTAIGEEVEFGFSSLTPCAAKLLISHKNGIIKKQEFLNNDGCLAEVSFDYKIGDFVNKFRVGPDRVGQIIVDGNNFDIESNIIFEVE